MNLKAPLLVTCLLVSCSTMSANKAICEQIAKEANSGNLWHLTLNGREATEEEQEQCRGEDKPNLGRIYELQDKKGIQKYASFYSSSWGSCSDQRIFNFASGIASIDADASSDAPIEVSVEQTSEDEGIDLADAGARDELVQLGDKYFVIRTYYYFGRRTLKAASTAIGGHIDLVCKFSNQDAPRLVVRKASNPKLCRRVAKGQIEPVHWEPQEVRDRVENTLGFDGNLEKVSVVDLTGDGKPGTLGWIAYASGGGCGSDTIFLASVKSEKRRVMKDSWPEYETRVVHSIADEHLSKLLVSQGEKSGHYEGALGHDVHDVQVYVENDKPYLLANSKLLSFWHGRVRTWCEFDALTQHQVRTVYKPVQH